jgi:predicted nucleotidyltransferase
MIKLTKNQSTLLRLFYTNPNRSFYIQEIGRILGKKPGVFQRTLYDLEKQGVLKSEYQAHARFFKAAESYPLYSELNSIVRKTIGAVGGVKIVVEMAGDVEFAFLYGSFAKGTENELSDIDLMIIGAPDEAILVREFDALEKGIQREINYRILSAEEFKARISDRDPFLLDVLRGRIIVLKGNEVELRQMAPGSPDQETGSGFAANPKSIEKGGKRPPHRIGRPPD